MREVDQDLFEKRVLHFLERMEAVIEEHGWHGVGVFPDENVPEGYPPFVYTVGFLEHDHPEMIVLGLHPEVAHMILWEFFDRIKDGEKFKDGDVVSGISRCDFRIKAVPPDGAPLNWAKRYYKRTELPALQILWPDSENVFEGEEGFDEEQYGGLQDLDLVRSWDAEGDE